MSLDTHPNPQPNPFHRKIELQSPLDLTYLQFNVARSARAKLDLHFPPSASQPAPATIIPLDGSLPDPNHSDAPHLPTPEDPMRTQVQALVDSFLQQTWESARHSISINGLDANSFPQSSSTTATTSGNPGLNTHSTPSGEREGVDFTYSPYDASLQKRLAALHAELESLTTQVSKLRREAPRRAAMQYHDALAEAMEAEQTAFEERSPQQRPEPQNLQTRDSKHALDLDTVPPGWAEEVGVTYEHGLAELRRLAGLGGAEEAEQTATTGRGSLTEVVGKVQRARTVAMEFE